jgi:hypothetical protein
LVLIRGHSKLGEPSVCLVSIEKFGHNYIKARSTLRLEAKRRIRGTSCRCGDFNPVFHIICCNYSLRHLCVTPHTLNPYNLCSRHRCYKCRNTCVQTEDKHPRLFAFGSSVRKEIKFESILLQFPLYAL